MPANDDWFTSATIPAEQIDNQQAIPQMAQSQATSNDPMQGLIPAEQIDGPQAKATPPQGWQDKLKGTTKTFNQITDAAPLGFANALANMGLGATQAVAGGLNKIGALPDEANVNIPGIGPMDFGYKAGNEGINQMTASKDQYMKDQVGNNPLAKGLNVTGNIAGNIATFPAFEAAVPAKLAQVAGKLPAVGKIAADYLPTISASAAQAGVQPAQDQDQRLQNMEFGGAVGAAGKMTGNALSKAVTDPAKKAAMEIAEESNVPVYRAQVSDSTPVRAVASWEKDIPFSGAGSKIAEQKAAFNDAAAKTIGQSGDVTPETLAAADEQIGGTYKRIIEKGNYNLPVDKDFNSQLAEIRQDAQTNLVGEKLQAFNQQLKNIRSKIVNASTGARSNGEGIISGPQYQNLRSNISGILRSNNSSPYMGRMLGLLDQKIMGKMAPEDAGAFGDARSMYRNMLVLEKVVKMDPNNPITPQRLAVATRNGFSDYAYGSTNQLAKLGRLGGMLRDTYPNSGTPMRNQLFDAAKHAIAPAAGAAVGGAAGYHEKGAEGVLPGVIAGAVANRMLATPFLYSKMGTTPGFASEIAPATASAVGQNFINLHNQAKTKKQDEQPPDNQ